MSPSSRPTIRVARQRPSRRLAAWRCGIAGGIAMALAAGCKTQPYVNSHIESVNAEYRQLEDYVYALEEENARLQQEVAGLQSAGAARGTATDGPPGRGLFRRAPAGAAPGRSPARGQTAPDMEPPVIEMPGETPPARLPGSRSTLQRPAAESAPADTPPSIELPDRAPQPANPAGEEMLPGPAMPKALPAPAGPEAIPAQPTDKKVTHLFLNPLSGGTDFDGQPGDDGLRVVVEPRNAADEYVAAAGSLSVVLLDPDREGDAARVARWDFDSSAARQLLAASSPGRGIKLEVPWPAAAPAANRLKMFVRYETPDGRRLQADREIFITQPGQAVSRWTPRTGGREAAAGVAAASAVEGSDR